MMLIINRLKKLFILNNKKNVSDSSLKKNKTNLINIKLKIIIKLNCNC